MDTPSNNKGRRKFIALMAGVLSAFVIGDRALAAKKPAAKKSTQKKATKKATKKAPPKKASAKPVAKSTPTPQPSATPSPSASPTASASASPSSSPTPSASPASDGPPANAKALTVAGKTLTTAELAVGATTAATFPKNGITTSVLVTRIDEKTFIALKPVCTHAGGPVELIGGSLLCTYHNSRFNQRTGAVISGPASDSLAQEKVALFGDTVYFIP